mgnify:CR=1 FL=1
MKGSSSSRPSFQGAAVQYSDRPAVGSSGDGDGLFQIITIEEHDLIVFDRAAMSLVKAESAALGAPVYYTATAAGGVDQYR